jgi:hypothetical protein
VYNGQQEHKKLEVAGIIHVTNLETGEEYDLLKEDTGWYDPDYEFSV